MVTDMCLSYPPLFALRHQSRVADLSLIGDNKRLQHHSGCVVRRMIYPSLRVPGESGEPGQHLEPAESATAAHVRERLAIILEGEVTAAPVIASPIAGGRAIITLGAPASFDQMRRDAQDLAAVLRSGAMPAPLRIVEW